MFTSNLRIGGLSSGIDTESLVQDLMRVARLPVDKKVREKQTWTWKQEEYRSINLSLLSLRNKAFDMKLTAPYLAKKVTSSDPGLVTAQAQPTAAAGTYSIKVEKLATNATNASMGTISADVSAKIDAGSSLLSQADKFSVSGSFFAGKTVDDVFTVSVNGKEFSFSYGESLDRIIATINASDAGASLFYDSVTDKLVASSAATGAEAELALTGEFFNTVLKMDNQQVRAGTDASFSINGLQTTRSGNSFTINGTTFNLQGLTEGGWDGKAVQVVVAQDTDAIYDHIVDFINHYNEVYEEISSKLKEEKYRDFYPLTDEEKAALSDTEIEKWEKKARSGLLKHDDILNGLINEMRNCMSSIVRGVDGPGSLAEIGITTGNYWEGNNGKLFINERKLRAAIENDPEGVAQLFNNDSDIGAREGIATRLYETMTKSMDRIISHAGSGASLYDQSYISRTIREIDDQLASMENRLLKVEERYWRQFTAMERAIASINQQSSWLTSQLAGLMRQE